MNLFFISDAFAVPTNGASPAGQGFESILLLLGFILIFYFLLWRPQTKRAKEHQQLIASLAIGDEIVTSGGLVGRINKITDNFVHIAVNEGVEVIVQKSAIAGTLPKGTMSSV